MQKISFANFSKFNICYLLLIFCTSLLVIDNMVYKAMFSISSLIVMIVVLTVKGNSESIRLNTIITFLLFSFLTFVSRFINNEFMIYVTLLIFILYLIAMFFTNFVFLDEN